MGFVKFRFELLGASDKPVVTLLVNPMFGRRAAAPATEQQTQPAAEQQAQPAAEQQTQHAAEQPPQDSSPPS
jgi:hypothetical protein